MGQSTFESTHLWRSTLAPQGDADPYKDARDDLRTAFLRFRERASQLAGEIARDLPDFTVHDVTHLDALWEMADRIAGPDYVITPTEAFVLGGAFLIHDLGMGLAAYPDGVKRLRQDSGWADTVAVYLRRHLGRVPSAEEINSPPKEIEKEVVGEMLRNLHAKHADQLALVHWADPSGTVYHLIDKPELRELFGATIGRIAYSHWWSVSELFEKLKATLGAPVWCPHSWTVDPLKLACLLRVADASHIDSQRAPGFLRALRRPQGVADAHWKFQQKLHKPRIENSRLSYTSGSRFSLDDAAAWWICLDTLQMIDRELRQVDALLADTNRPQLAVRGVAHVDDAARLTELIPTEGWTPIDTRVRVTDVPSLIERLGGQELYGADPTVPLRELIQNASDAVRARRCMEDRGADWGAIIVRLGSDEGGPWIEVEDNGIGMSAQVLSGPLLDFGTTYWTSLLARQETPGLLAKGFESTGRFGIGFFSVFMWGQHVRVTTRRPEEAQKDTRVLDFSTGVQWRPILRPAYESERLRDGGTRVRVWLKKDPEKPGGLLYHRRTDRVWTLEQLCAWLCPALETNLFVEGKKIPTRVIAASDWINIEPAAFLRRLVDLDDFADEGIEKGEDFINMHASMLRTMCDTSGRIVGRGCVVTDEFRSSARGVVTVGGLRTCSLGGILGILVGNTTRAARDTAIPIISHDQLAEWASEQSNIVANATTNVNAHMIASEVIFKCNGNTGTLAIARNQEGGLTKLQIQNWTNIPDEILIVDSYATEPFETSGMGIRFHPNVIIKTGTGTSILQSSFFFYHEWPTSQKITLTDKTLWSLNTALDAILMALAEAWSVPTEAIFDAIKANHDYMFREIGIAAGHPVMARVHAIQNPRTRSTISNV